MFGNVSLTFEVDLLIVTPCHLIGITFHLIGITFQKNLTLKSMSYSGEAQSLIIIYLKAINNKCLILSHSTNINILLTTIDKYKYKDKYKYNCKM